MPFIRLCEISANQAVQEAFFDEHLPKDANKMSKNEI